MRSERSLAREGLALLIYPEASYTKGQTREHDSSRETGNPSEGLEENCCPSRAARRPARGDVLSVLRLQSAGNRDAAADSYDEVACGHETGRRAVHS